MSTETSAPPHVIVLGAGYAGAHAAAVLRRGPVTVTVIDPDGLHGFLPRLAGVAAGRLRPGDARAPLADLVDVEVLRGQACHLDVAGRAVHLADGSRLRYDALVATTGGSAASAPVPGAAEHGWPLHTPVHALALRTALAEADRVIVVGGGATGVQVAAEVAVARPGGAVSIVEQRPRLLADEPRRLSRWVTRLVRRHGVEVLTDTSVARVEPDGVVLADGRERTGITIWAGGWEADASTLFPDAPLRDGRLVVDADLQVPGSPGVVAAGDLAAHVDVLGRPLAMSAQIALQAGAHAGRTALALATGGTTRPARLFELGRVVDLGRTGVARVGPVALGRGPTARLVPLLHQVIDLRHLVKLGGPFAVLGHRTGVGATDDPARHHDPLHAVG